MEEFYNAIEEKIKASGYEKEISGKNIYNQICDEIDEKENGTYIFMAKAENCDDVFEYKITIMDEEFNLSSITIFSKDTDKKFFINFD